MSKYNYIINFAVTFFLVFVLWFLKDNYYTEYEAFISNIYAYNFGNGNEHKSFSGFAPLGYILFEFVWGKLYGFENNIPWYDYTMFFLTTLGALAFFLGLSYKKVKSGYFLLCFLIGFILFYWLIRLQNHTHTAYLLCFSGLFSVNQSVMTKGGRGLVILGILNYCLGFFIRWEIGFITMGFYTIFVLVHYQFLREKYTYLLYFIFFSLLVYVWYIFKTDTSFYHQIEPDGEYVVLYQKSLRLPSGANALDTLKYEMLNSWIVDDANLITIEYFKEAVGHAKSFQNKNLFDDLNEGFDRFKEYLAKRWYLSLFLFYMALLALMRRDFRPILFLTFSFGLIFAIAYKSLLTERHYYSILGGILLFFTPNFTSYRNTQKLIMTILLVCVSYLLYSDVDKDLNIQKYIYEERLLIHNKIEEASMGGTLMTDAQYQEIFLNRTMEKAPFLKNIIVISFQQHSYNPVFKKYIPSLFGIEALNQGALFEAIKNNFPDAVILMSNKRKNVINNILIDYYGKDFYLYEDEKLCNENDAEPFSCPALMRIRCLDFSD